MRKELSNKIYVYTFVMTIFVVIYHCSKWFMQEALGTTYNVGFFRSYIYNFFESTGHISVGFFFAISAFLFFKSQKSNSEKIKKRLKTLGIPFLFWNLIYMLLVIAGIYDYEISSAQSIIFGFSIYPFDGALWYMLVLLIFFLLTPVISKLRDKKKLLLVLIAATFALAFVTSYCYEHEVIQFQYFDFIERMIRYFPAFLFGAALGMNEDIANAFRELGKKGHSLLWLAAFLLSLAVITVVDNSEITWLFYRISPIIVWNILSEVNFKKDVPACFRCTFLIYATHPFIVSFIRRLIQNKEIVIPASSLLHVITFVIINILIVFVINTILDFLIKKLPDKARVVITGGR